MIVLRICDCGRQGGVSLPRVARRRELPQRPVCKRNHGHNAPVLKARAFRASFPRAIQAYQEGLTPPPPQKKIIIIFSAAHALSQGFTLHPHKRGHTPTAPRSYANLRERVVLVQESQESEKRGAHTPRASGDTTAGALSFSSQERKRHSQRGLPELKGLDATRTRLRALAPP